MACTAEATWPPLSRGERFTWSARLFESGSSNPLAGTRLAPYPTRVRIPLGGSLSGCCLIVRLALCVREALDHSRQWAVAGFVGCLAVRFVSVPAPCFACANNATHGVHHSTKRSISADEVDLTWEFYPQIPQTEQNRQKVRLLRASQWKCRSGWGNDPPNESRPTPLGYGCSTY